MRDINQLHPELIKKVYELIELCSKNGITIGISECLRTVAEQDALYAKGRTAPGSKVTNCKGSTYSSMHQWGVAFDFYLKMDVDGDGSISDDAFNDATGLFGKVGALGESIGLEWGGSWKSIKDKPHFQLPQWGSTATKLKSLYGSPEAFMKTWSSVATPAPTTPNPSTTTESTGLGVARVTAVSGLKVRSTPNTVNDSNKIGVIPYKGTCDIVKLNVSTTGGTDWALIRYNGTSGYVAQKYLDIVTYPTGYQVTESASHNTSNSYTKAPVQGASSFDSVFAGKYTVKANLNLRNGAGTQNTSVLNVIPQGRMVQNYGYYTKKDGTVWLLVAYEKYTGYVSMNYLIKG